MESLPPLPLSSSLIPFPFQGAAAASLAAFADFCAAAAALARVCSTAAHAPDWAAAALNESGMGAAWPADSTVF